MLKLRYYSRLLQAFFTRFKAIILIGTVVGVIFFTALAFVLPHFTYTSERIGITGRYTTDNLPKDVLSLVGEGLTNIDSSGNVMPGLASSWETTNDGKTWVFHLDQNKKWQDGKPITSDSLTIDFADVNVNRPDNKTITFELKEKFAPFPSVVSQPLFKKGFLGSGEWKVVKLSLVGEHVEKFVIENKNKHRMIFRFYPTEDQTKLAYKLGQVDEVRDLIDPTPLNSWKNVNIEEQTLTNRYTVIFLNTSDIFADKSLRQALYYAIDKDSLGENRALGPISPDSWAYNSQIKSYDFDRKRAQELIDDLPDEVKSKLEFKLTTNSALLPLAEKIAKDWEQVGVKANISVEVGIPNDYQAFLAIYDSPYDPDQYATWHSSQQATNISKFSNPRIDKLLEDGRLELDINERKRIYLDFQRYLLEDAPAIFLYHPTSYTIKRK